jgi:predicted secreted acid phosphatase
VTNTILAALAVIAVGGGIASADEPKAPASPRQIVEYHDSGEWRADTARALRRAQRVLRGHLDTRRPAIVLDVDDTALSTYTCMKRAGFDRTAAKCGSKRSLPAIPPTRRLFRFARRHGVDVFFITGRRERLREITAGNLHRAGYAGWRRLQMRPNRQPADHKDGWKARARRAIERRGYRIVVNIGDQRSDLDGGHAIRAVKIPNPMYVIADA